MRNARMLLKHVKTCSNISKLKAGNLPIELVGSDVATLVRFIASHFGIVATARNVTLQLDVPESLLRPSMSPKCSAS